MKKSKFNNNTGHLKSQKRGAGRSELLDNEEEFIRRKFKKSGKRFHRKKTLREEYWDDLMDKV